MFRLRNLVLFGLVAGLIAVEVFSKGIFNTSSVQSQHQLSAREQTAIMSILQNGLGGEPTETLSRDRFPNFTIPTNPAEVAGDTLRSYGLISGTASPTRLNPSYYIPAGYTNSSLLEGVVPPAGSELYYAYQDGGRYWYGRDDNVLVIFPDETIRSFNSRTGVPTTWLQDRLAATPITDPEAYTNYQANYRAKIVAETSTWVLMEFPSSGVLKVAKPASLQPATPVATPSIYGLPGILPGYES